MFRLTTLNDETAPNDCWRIGSASRASRRRPEGMATMNYDALLAALLAGVITLLACLFWPGLADQLPELARMAIIYLVTLLAGSWIFGLWRRRRRK
jgi:asparagine N-glycosylation enzyme membrane subunit Stt3